MKQKHAKGPDGEMRTPPTSGRGRGRPRKNVRFLLEIILNELLALSTYWPQERWVFSCSWEKRWTNWPIDALWQDSGWHILDLLEVKWQTVQIRPRVPNVPVSSIVFCSLICKGLHSEKWNSFKLRSWGTKGGSPSRQGLLEAQLLQFDR